MDVGGPAHNPVICLQFLRVEEREMGSPYTGPEALKKGPLFIKKVDTNQEPKAPSQGECPANLPCPPDPASDTKETSKSSMSATSATIVTTEPMPQETGSEPKGFCESLGKKKSLGTIFLTVPGPHSPGPIQSPRPLKCPASPLAWPPKRVAPSMSSLNSLASSCFDLTDISFNIEYAPLCFILSKTTCVKNTFLNGEVDTNSHFSASSDLLQSGFMRGSMEYARNPGQGENEKVHSHCKTGAGLWLLWFLTTETLPAFPSVGCYGKLRMWK